MRPNEYSAVYDYVGQWRQQIFEPGSITRTTMRIAARQPDR